MDNLPRLGVNIDHVATLRNARGDNYPSPLRAALLCQEYGVDGITAHLREDRRHIKDDDILEIKEKVDLPFKNRIETHNNKSISKFIALFQQIAFVTIKLWHKMFDKKCFKMPLSFMVL